MTEENSLLQVTPLQVNFYKKRAAVRLQLSPPVGYEVGCLFLTFAKSKGSNGAESGYDWTESHVVVKLGLNDILSLINSCTYFTDASLYHEFKSVVKTITMQFKQDESGDAFISVKEVKAEVENSISVLLKVQEVMGVLILLRQALIRMHNW